MPLDKELPSLVFLLVGISQPLAAASARGALGFLSLFSCENDEFFGSTGSCHFFVKSAAFPWLCWVGRAESGNVKLGQLFAQLCTQGSDDATAPV